MVGLIRYVQEPPGIDCDKVSAEKGLDLQTLAYIEYKEQGDIALHDPDTDINLVASR